MRKKTGGRKSRWTVHLNKNFRNPITIIYSSGSTGSGSTALTHWAHRNIGTHELHLRDWACEVDRGQIWAGCDDFAEDRTLGRHKVHHAVGEAGRLEDLEDQVVGEDGRVARLPYCHIALQQKSLRVSSLLWSKLLGSKNCFPTYHGRQDEACSTLHSRYYSIVKVLALLLLKSEKLHRLMLFDSNFDAKFGCFIILIFFKSNESMLDEVANILPKNLISWFSKCSQKSVKCRETRKYIPKPY